MATPREDCALLLDLSLRCTGYCVVPWPPAIADDNRLNRLAVEPREAVPPQGEFKIERPTVATQQRVGMLSLLVGELIDTYQPLFVASEMPINIYQAREGGKSVGSMSSVTVQQKAFGAVMAMCWERGVPFLEVDPAWSKHCLTGDRRASKRKVAENLAKRLGMVVTPGKPIRFAKGWTEAVRDALAVIFFLQYRRNVFGSDWLNILLGEQGKPATQDHRPWRGLLYDDLVAELKMTHSAPPAQKTPKQSGNSVPTTPRTRKVTQRYGRNTCPPPK